MCMYMCVVCKFLVCVKIIIRVTLLFNIKKRRT